MRLPDRGRASRNDGRMDELSALLRARGCTTAAANGRGARDDLSVRAVSRRRRENRDAGTAKRARVERILREGAEKRGARDRSPLRIKSETRGCARRIAGGE